MVSSDFNLLEKLDEDYCTGEQQMAEVPPELAKEAWRETLKILRKDFKTKWVNSKTGRRYLVINHGL